MYDKPDVYIENSIISYLAARPSKNLLVAAWQQITMDWWENRRSKFDLYISELVVTEASKGDPDAAKLRLEYLKEIDEVPITEGVKTLAGSFIKKGVLPINAIADALHIAVAAYHDIRYLLTWNCTHIDNAEIKPEIRSICIVEGYNCPEICTPQELMGDQPNER